MKRIKSRFMREELKNIHVKTQPETPVKKPKMKEKTRHIRMR